MTKTFSHLIRGAETIRRSLSDAEDSRKDEEFEDACVELQQAAVDCEVLMQQIEEARAEAENCTAHAV